MRKQLRIDVSSETMEGLKAAAQKNEITPNVLVRMNLAQIYKGETESRIVKLKNWREIEIYAAAKSYELNLFINNAVNYFMKKNALTPAQKAEFVKNIEN